MVTGWVLAGSIILHIHYLRGYPLYDKLCFRIIFMPSSQWKLQGNIFCRNWVLTAFYKILDLQINNSPRTHALNGFLCEGDTSSTIQDISHKTNRFWYHCFTGLQNHAKFFFMWATLSPAVYCHISCFQPYKDQQISYILYT